nr:alpha-amylase family glycosyl hydrolase [Geminisphaera colitermitum]
MKKPSELRSFSGPHFGISIGLADGRLASIRRTRDGAQIYADDGGDRGLRACVGGIPRPFPNRGGVDSWRCIVDGRPADSVFVGGAAVYEGLEQTDLGDALQISVRQRDGLWRFVTHYIMEKADPVLRMDWEIHYNGEDSQRLHFLEWKWADWAFADQRFPWQTDKGNFQTQPLRDGGSIVLWRKDDGEWWQWNLAPAPSRSVECRLFVGGRLSGGQHGFRGGGFHIGLSDGIGAASADIVPRWYASHHLHALGMPATRPVHNAHIYETFIGWRMIVGETTGTPPQRLEPYPTTEALAADLPRIKALGFDTIYLMPRQPFPGYTTASLTDPALQYGDGEGTGGRFRSLTKSIHALGMSVIVDVVLHGGMDHGTLDFQDGIIDSLPGNWGKNNHLAHSEIWRSEAPKQHPLWEAHPEWFCQFEDGRAQIGYTRAFDLRHPGFQEYFVQSLASLVSEYGIDGFRFDAPWWTIFAYRWKEDAGYRASWQAGAAAQLVSRLHLAVQRVKPDTIFFMESSDPFTCQPAHLKYPYAVQRIVLTQMQKKLMTARVAREALSYLRKVRLPGVSVAHWMVDSHDSVWAYRWNEKWLHRHVGLPLARAFAGLVAFEDGALMSFTGSETHMEEWFRLLMRLRRELPVLAHGQCDELAVLCDNEHVFPLWRWLDCEWLLPVVNFSNETQTVRLGLPSHPVVPRGCALTDHLDPAANIRWGGDGDELLVDLPPCATRLIGASHPVTERND